MANLGYMPIVRDLSITAARSVAQGYLALEGCRYLKARNNQDKEGTSIRIAEGNGVPPADTLDKAIAHGTRMGWFFVVLNALDEVKVLLSDGGVDEHLHHLVCIGGSTVITALLTGALYREHLCEHEDFEEFTKCRP